MGKTAIASGGPNDKAVLQGLYLFPSVVGDLRFVNATGGLTGGPGVVPEDAYATLQQAHDASTASQGDEIRLMPGHAETFVGAAGFTFSKAGLRVQGLGVGRNRPTFSFTTSTAAQVIISGANTLFSNIIFDLTGINAIVAAISITGADVAFEDCEFILSTGTNAPVLAVLTAATANRLRFERCRFIGPAVSTSTVTACIQHEAGVDYLIKDCFFTGKMTQAILNVATVLRGMIDGNRFVIGTGTVAITMAAASTPFICNNRFNMPSGTTPIVAAAGFVAGNIYSAAAGVSAGTASTI